MSAKSVVRAIKYVRWLVGGATSFADVVAIPKIAAHDLRVWGAQLLLDHTGKFGRTVAAEVGYRWHLKRARALKSDVYCVYHACDAKHGSHPQDDEVDGPQDGSHPRDDEVDGDLRHAVQNGVREGLEPLAEVVHTVEKFFNKLRSIKTRQKGDGSK